MRCWERPISPTAHNAYLRRLGCDHCSCKVGCLDQWGIPTCVAGCVGHAEIRFQLRCCRFRLPEGAEARFAARSRRCFRYCCGRCCPGDMVRDCPSTHVVLRCVRREEGIESRRRRSFRPVLHGCRSVSHGVPRGNVCLSAPRDEDHGPRYCGRGSHERSHTVSDAPHGDSGHVQRVRPHLRTLKSAARALQVGTPSPALTSCGKHTGGSRTTSPCLLVPTQDTAGRPGRRGRSGI
jgi:hypothetical protein